MSISRTNPEHHIEAIESLSHALNLLVEKFHPDSDGRMVAHVRPDRLDGFRITLKTYEFRDDSEPTSAAYPLEQGSEPQAEHRDEKHPLLEYPRAGIGRNLEDL